jgi:MYXO-CTERM domain-containing protein
MRTITNIALGGFFGAFALLCATETDARACGGCFAPPTENNTVVTDHRMIFTVSQQQTTLYDQIKYSGSPSSFAWVLPISGAATVGLSSDALFAVLDAMTQVQVQQPPTRCPAQPADCQRGLAVPSAAGAANDKESGGGVTVTKQEVVGPYETVQLKSDDPNALNNWLTGHGYNIPEEIKPVIAAYVAGKYDFLALKLVPGASVSAMRPVRVSTQGAGVALPLRMVAAGTGANVGITLWIVGEGRYEPQNFPFFTIKDDDIAWNWNTNASTYKEVRAQRTKDSNGKAWEIESSLALSQQQIEQGLKYGYFVGPGGGGAPASSQTDYPASTKAESDALLQQDLDTLFKGISPANMRVTRIRSDLARAGLAEDLVLGAAKDQAIVGTTRLPSQEIGQPLCTVWQGCQANGQAPRDEAVALSSSSGNGKESFSCTTAEGHRDSGFGALAGLAGLAGVVFARGRKKRA